MTPYLLALGLWTLGWLGYSRRAWRRLERRHAREWQRFLNRPWGR